MSKRKDNRERLKRYIGDLTTRQKNLIWPDISELELYSSPSATLQLVLACSA
jgi:hypothetical protein